MRYFNAQGIFARDSARRAVMQATIRSRNTPPDMPDDMCRDARNVRTLLETMIPSLRQIYTVQSGHNSMAWAQCKAQLGLFI